MQRFDRTYGGFFMIINKGNLETYCYDRLKKVSEGLGIGSRSGVGNSRQILSVEVARLFWEIILLMIF